MAVELKDLAPLLLKKERANGTIDVLALTNMLRNGPKRNARRKQIVEWIQQHPVLSDRDYIYRNHAERYKMGVQKAYHYIQFCKEHNLTSKEEQQYAYAALGEPLAIDVHRSMFIPTLENQADPEQQAKWLPLAHNFQILGAYAQTELGHGSNVQGIETIATYDKATQEFIIYSPTLTSRKWWPGGLGKTATHAIVHARLLLNDGQQDVGIQAFLVPIRCLKTHEPLPGIEVGDIGPKVGFQAVDNGYCAFDHVRIPRDHMMMRYAKVLPDGTFVKPKSDKLVYLTMVQVRAYLLVKFGQVMGAATTITTRFSAARVQGRSPKAPNKGEWQVLDYQNQQFALFPFLAISYAATFAGKMMIQMHDDAVDGIKRGQGGFGLRLASLHAVSSGLKAWLANHVSDGIEACRRLCGGHGFSQASHLPHLFAEVVGACTFEGTFDVLVQQHARYLIKVLTMGVKLDKSQQMLAFLSQTKEYANAALRWQGPSSSTAIQSSQDLMANLLQAFEVRAARRVVRLAGAMKENQNDPNACMVLMSRASVAHTELMLLQTFVNGIKASSSSLDTATHQTLVDLCTLLALWLMLRDMAAFRDHDFVSTAQADAMQHYLLSRILPTIRTNAVLLTDAWDFSDFELNSAIGRYDGDIYRALVERAAKEPLNQTQVVHETFESYLKPLLRSSHL